MLEVGLPLKLEKPGIWQFTGLPHTQGTQGNSGNFQVEENLRENQGILIFFLNSGKLREVLIFFLNIQGSLKIF